MSPKTATTNVTVSNFNAPAATCTCTLVVASSSSAGAVVIDPTTQAITVDENTQGSVEMTFQMSGNTETYNFVTISFTGTDSTNEFTVGNPSPDGQSIVVTDNDVSSDVGTVYNYTITVSNSAGQQASFDPDIETEN